MNYLGIDNGLNGGVAVLSQDGEILLKAVMPNHKVKIGKRVRNRVDARELFKMINPYKPFKAAVECPTGSKSINAATSMADSYARIEATLHLMSVQPESMTNSWQKSFWTKPKRGSYEAANYNTKVEALRVAQSMWPSAQFFATRRSTTPHDGIIDALLIAEHLRRNETNHS